MSAPTFPFELVTREGIHGPWPVTAVDAPGEEGRFTVLARHEPLVAGLAAGRLAIVRADGAREDWTIAAGTLTVGAEGVVVLVPAAARA